MRTKTWQNYLNCYLPQKDFTYNLYKKRFWSGDASIDIFQCRVYNYSDCEKNIRIVNSAYFIV